MHSITKCVQYIETNIFIQFTSDSIVSCSIVSQATYKLESELLSNRMVKSDHCATNENKPFVSFGILYFPHLEHVLTTN